MAYLTFPSTAASKYRNKKTVIDGITFASKREANRYAELKLLERVGEIIDLKCQPRYSLATNGVKLGTYVADFSYREKATNESVVEDVKSKPTITAIYRLKKKLMLAIHGIEVKEVF